MEGTTLALERSLIGSGLVRICAAAVFISLLGLAMRGGSAHATDSLEARKQPMTFKWVTARQGACEPDCRDWISAVGIITSDTPSLFDSFTKGHDLKGQRIVIDSSGGSVLDAIAIGRTWRAGGVIGSVGVVTERDGARAIAPEGYCESMCVFLLLGAATREIPPQAHVRVHQIWMGDRANDAKASKYTAEDMTIVERDVGRLAKYTFDMGGSGDLLALALSVPPWEPLHELSAAELVTSNLIPASAMADNAAKADTVNTDVSAKVADLPADAGMKPVQDRMASESAPAVKATKTAEALPPTGGMAAPSH
ncbi:MAG: hypothetical protein EKK40_16035 [Bradyrhizobiaceae bacterium]|nr:MAG: hypothetical protein EKK40_16035 [Bradyrhizobiaceae bacterium]